ncbi:MAG TPA: acyl-CoA dehydrogenase family protein [Jatrophihabitantaceae bacterium]|jgi:alkylation response protein AidB-like acyl-CoA dehydrogenase
MDLTLSADQRALQTGLRDVLADLWSAEHLREAAAGAAPGNKDWRSIAELGVFGVTVPEAEDGMGLGLADAAVLFEELGAALVPGPLVPTALAAGRVAGTIDGSAIVTMLDLRAPVLLVEHLDLATHVVALDADGLRVLPADALDATPVQTPLDPLTPLWSVPGDVRDLGERIGSAGEVADWMRRGAVLNSALQVGVARGALDLAVRYSLERVQFDRVIGGFQAVKHLLADSLVRVDVSRAAVLVAALTVDDPPAAEADEAAEAVAAAKVLADEAATLGGRSGLQVHGGMGFTWEVLAHLYLKRAWVLETSFGSADEHAEFLATKGSGVGGVGASG